MLHFLFSFMNKLNQTESAVFGYYHGPDCSQERAFLEFLLNLMAFCSHLLLVLEYFHTYMCKICLSFDTRISDCIKWRI